MIQGNRQDDDGPGDDLLCPVWQGRSDLAASVADDSHNEGAEERTEDRSLPAVQASAANDNRPDAPDGAAGIEQITLPAQGDYLIVATRAGETVGDFILTLRREK